MTNRKICFVVSSPGTAVSFLSGAMSRLKDEYDIYLVANFDGARSVDMLPLCGKQHIPIERRPHPFVDLKALWRLYRYFKHNDFYAVHSYTLKASLLTAIAGWCARVPHRLRNFSGQLWCNMTGLKRRFYKMIEHIIVALDNGFIIDCNAQRQYLIDEGILKSHDQAKVMYRGSVCGINPAKFEFHPDERAEIRQELGFPDGAVVFIFLGRMRREKGIYELFEAFNRLAGEYNDCRLLLVGNDEGDCVKDIGQYSHLVAGSNVVVYGYTQRPAHLLHAADVYVLPSHREGFGMAVLEASCLGLPVICSDTYGMTDAMRDDITGLRCRTKDAESLYRCMLQLYQDPALRKQMGWAGHEWVVEDFPQDKVNEAWLQFYHDLEK